MLRIIAGTLLAAFGLLIAVSALSNPEPYAGEASAAAATFLLIFVLPGVALVAFGIRARRRRSAARGDAVVRGIAPTRTSTVAPAVTSAAPPPMLANSTGTGPIRLTASPQAVELLRAWNGRWLLLAHRAAGIRSAADLNGRKLFIAWINTGEDLTFGGAAPRSIEEAVAIEKALGITFEHAITNNAEMYPGQLLGDPARIGMLVPAVARHLGLSSNPYLAQLEFEAATPVAAFSCSACGKALEEIGIPPAISMARLYGGVVDIGTEEVPAEIKADPFVYRGFFCRICQRTFCPACSHGQGDICPACGGRSLLPAYRPLLAGVCRPQVTEDHGDSDQ